MSMFFRVTIACTSAFVFFSVFAARPLAAQAFVIDVPGAILVDGGIYRGTCHHVITPSGEENISCHLTLDTGTPESETTHISYIGSNKFGPPIPCDAVITPNGRANVTCHN